MDIVQNINNFLKKSEIQYATAIIGSKNRVDLILKQEQEIISVIENLELIEKAKRMISFDPIIGVDQKMTQLLDFELMSEISNERGNIKVLRPSTQPVTEAFIIQDE